MIDKLQGAGKTDPIDLTVVTPMRNEAMGIVAFLEELRGVLDSLSVKHEVILVDDGSDDDSAMKALALAWPHLRVLSLARNYGHQVAIEAGLSVAQGNWIVSMDSDGQHPPEAIREMITLMKATKVDVVYAVPTSRRTDPRAKKVFALTYYKLVRALTGIAITDSQADFRLISRRVLSDIADVPGDKTLRLLLPAIGYRSVTMSYELRNRIAGAGRFGMARQLRLAMSSVIDFSAKPLRLVAAVGAVISLGSLLWLAYVVAIFLTTSTITGWSSVMAAVLVVGGMTLLGVSIVGEYVARIHDLLRAHPRYVAQFLNDDSDETQRRGLND